VKLPGVERRVIGIFPKFSIPILRCLNAQKSTAARLIVLPRDRLREQKRGYIEVCDPAKYLSGDDRASASSTLAFPAQAEREGIYGMYRLGSSATRRTTAIRRAAMKSVERLCNDGPFGVSCCRCKGNVKKRPFQLILRIRRLQVRLLPGVLLLAIGNSATRHPVEAAGADTSSSDTGAETRLGLYSELQTAFAGVAASDRAARSARARSVPISASVGCRFTAQ
jgi:hypothetical protein